MMGHFSLIYQMILVFWLISAPAWGALQATIDRETVYEGETFNLVIEVDGNHSEFDAGVLTTDFFIHGQAVHQQIQQVGQRLQQKNVRIVTLEPKRQGNLTIPALQIGREKTNPLSITVLAAIDDQQGTPALVELAVEPQNPFVQQQVTISQRVLVRADLPLLPGSLTVPVDDSQAVWHKLGDDREMRVERQGFPYRMIERRYAMFPPKSGQITLQPFTFDGRIAQNRPNQRQFGSNSLLFNAGRRVVLNSEAFTLNVQAIPAQAKSPWIPAHSVGIRANWPQERPTFRVGEPVVRTVIVEMQGQDATTIPDLSWDLPAGLQFYTEPPTRSTRQDQNFLIGRLEQRLTVLPTKMGSFSLPAITVYWWDVANNRAQTAAVASETITVFPGAGGNAGNEPPTTTAELPVTPSDSLTATPVKELPTSVTEIQSLPNISDLWEFFRFNADYQLWHLATLVLLSLWLLTLLGWRRSIKTANYATNTQKPAVKTPSFSQVKRLLQGDDPHEVRKTLLAWAASYWPYDPPLSLAEIAVRVPQWNDWLEQLDRACYSNATANWHTVLRKPHKLVESSNHEPHPLIPLYPESPEK